MRRRLLSSRMHDGMMYIVIVYSHSRAVRKVYYVSRYFGALHIDKQGTDETTDMVLADCGIFKRISSAIIMIDD